MPMRYRTVNGERQLTPSMGKRGYVRRHRHLPSLGLAPGKYYLSARAEEWARFGRAARRTRTSPASRRPSTPARVAAEAQPIEVVAGAEVVADLQLVDDPHDDRHRRRRRSGRRAGDRRLHHGIGVQRQRRPFDGGGGGTIKPDGTFIVSGIAPGEYTLVAQPTFGEKSMFEPFGQENARGRRHAPIVASGAPITGLRLVVQDPIRIPVNVTFEDGGADKPERVYRAGESRARHGQRHGRRCATAASRWRSCPGTYRLSAYSHVRRHGMSRPWIASGSPTGAASWRTTRSN